MHTIAVAVAMAAGPGRRGRDSARRDGLQRLGASMRVGRVEDASGPGGDEMAEWKWVGEVGLLMALEVEIGFVSHVRTVPCAGDD